MQAQIDKFGRVVIPKIIREHLGLQTGTVLLIEEHYQEVVLKVVDRISPIKVKEGIAVYNAQAVGDIEAAVEDERNKRLKDLENK